jgi:hypothetical protein
MDYEKAEKIRKQSFGSLLGEQEGGFGASLKSAISQKTRAKVTGIKEKFDPMNLARAVGGRTGAAIYGKIFGRDRASMERFADVRKKRVGFGESDQGGTSSSVSDALGLIYRMMLRNDEDDKLQYQLSQNKKEEEESEEEDRNQQLIRALTGRKTEPSRKEKKAKRRAERKEEKKQKKEKPKKVETQTTTKVPTETSVPKKAPGIVSKIKGFLPSIPTAAKIGTGAAIIGAGGLLMPSESVASVINKASDQVGVDRSLMYAIAKQESGFNPNAAAKTSSAKGLYQFIKGTWKNMVDKYGSTYPILRERGPEDPEANAIAGALFIKENSNYLIKNNIPVNATTIYAAHFLGAGGAKTLLSSDPNRNAAELMPAAAKANQFIFYDKKNNNQPRTVQQVIDVLFQKVGQYQEKYNQALNIPSVAADKIDMASKENKALKAKPSDSPSAITINNTNSTQQTTTTAQRPQNGNDKSAYQKKVQG